MAKNPPRKGLRRRDATGHLDPQYAEELLEQSRSTLTSDPPAAAFVDDTDDLATPLAEDFVQAATSAEDGDSDQGDELIRVEPFVPDGDDDDLAFEPEELMFPPVRPHHAEVAAAPVPARVRRPAKRAVPKAAKSKSATAKSVSSSRSKPKAKTQAVKTKAVKTKAVKTKAVKTKAVKTKAAKAGPVRKKTKPSPARKTAKRGRKAAKRSR
jgi:hypothetical protein